MKAEAFPRLAALKYKHNRWGSMMIDWYIGKRCNFACSYCADFIHDNYSAHVPFEKMKIFADKITSVYGTNIHWSLTGGEPTLNPDFLRLLEYLQDKKHEISVTTNGSRSADYLKKALKLSDNITFSLHFEHISSQLEAYIEKAIELEKCRLELNSRIPPERRGYEPGQIHPKQLLLRFMALPGFLREIEAMGKRLAPHIEKIEYRVIRPQKESFLKKAKAKTEKGHWKWRARPPQTPISADSKVAPDKAGRSSWTETEQRESRYYSEKDRAVLERLYRKTSSERKWLTGFMETESGEIIKRDFHYNELNFQRKTGFRGWTCYAGVRLLKVAPNGDIFIANCFQGGALGNIYTLDSSFQPPKRPVICQKPRCSDPMDLRQPKYISEKYKSLVLD